MKLSTEERKITGFIFTVSDLVKILEKHGYIYPLLPDDTQVLGVKIDGDSIDPTVKISLESRKAEVKDSCEGLESYRFSLYSGYSVYYDLVYGMSCVDRMEDIQRIKEISRNEFASRLEN